jgi:hypothetical protein
MWVVDTEYCSFGNHARPRCLCALDLLSGERREVWLANVASPPCPFAMTADELFVFFAADADIGIFIALGWPIPRYVIDPRVEFMRIRNGLPPLASGDGGDPDISAEREIKAAKKRRKKPGRFSLVRIARYLGVECVDDVEKGAFRDLAMRRSDDFTGAEQRGLIGYRRGDVDATAGVLRRMWNDAELSDQQTFRQALIRGFYMAAAAWIQFVGIPLNLPLYRRFSMNSEALRLTFVKANSEFRCLYEDPETGAWTGHFSEDALEKFLREKKLLLEWPRTPTGKLVTSSKKLKRVAERHKIVAKLLAFLATVDLLEGIGTSFDEHGEIEEDQGKAKGIQICPDGRSRATLFPFGTKTSRNAPGGRAFLFSNGAWTRFLIMAARGRALAYLDWSGEELRLAAILSRDPALLKLCEREDPYIELVIHLGIAPPGATKKTHRDARKIGKVITLAMLYGGGPRMVVGKTGMSRTEAIALLRRQREAFPVFYRWSDCFAHCGLSGAPLWSPLGWRFWPRHRRGDEALDRTCRNYPVQSCGADIMRVAAILALEAGIAIVAVIHDAFLIEASVDSIGDATEKMYEIMVQAVTIVVGQPIPIDCKITGQGKMFYDEDGEEDFKMLMRMLRSIERGRARRKGE